MYNDCGHHEKALFKIGDASIHAGSFDDFAYFATHHEGEIGLTLNVSDGNDVMYETVSIVGLHTGVATLLDKYTGRKRYPANVTVSIPWRDLGAPTIEPSFWFDLVEYIKVNIKTCVFVHCVGGHGRTGTALSILAGISNATKKDPIKWLRKVYCKKIMESDDQIGYFVNVTGIYSDAKPYFQTFVSQTPVKDDAVLTTLNPDYPNMGKTYQYQSPGSVNPMYERKGGAYKYNDNMHWNKSDGFYYSDEGAKLSKDYQTAVFMLDKLMDEGECKLDGKGT